MYSPFWEQKEFIIAIICRFHAKQSFINWYKYTLSTIVHCSVFVRTSQIINSKHLQKMTTQRKCPPSLLALYTQIIWSNAFCFSHLAHLNCLHWYIIMVWHAIVCQWMKKTGTERNEREREQKQQNAMRAMGNKESRARHWSHHHRHIRAHTIMSDSVFSFLFSRLNEHFARDFVRSTS